MVTYFIEVTLTPSQRRRPAVGTRGSSSVIEALRIKKSLNHQPLFRL